ncbi:DnaJ C-terminal domain-containing protein [Nitrospirillum viridazoti]|uniref:DnaJ-class molecular chaperone n=1 Tax=Nitrospirillum amazonense TaxID=28077 RepID=A0A560IYV2_9PROT|nr:DnaJ C-terminal domain-containing protein [Nitrospirillum amazonense]TWB64017.1 DnaJ-class molecular chaperone [Nitrospirillum amazonense]
MRNPYDILGVSRTASAEEIRRAYRKLAKTHHPDLNQNHPEAERKFREVTAAYDLLSDAAKRARFDRGEIDADGNERPQAYSRRHHAGASGGGFQFTSNVGGMGGFEDIIADMFGGGSRTGAGPRKGQDISVSVTVDFIEAAKGGRHRVTLPDGTRLDVDLPPGLGDGGKVRLRGRGAPGTAGGPPGDALVTVSVRPHPWFRRERDDVYLDLPVTLYEAVFGAKVRVPTIDGSVLMTIPKGANDGTRLRLKGRGISSAGGRGDQYVTVRLALPPLPDPALESFLRNWRPAEYNPRKPMEGD